MVCVCVCVCVCETLNKYIPDASPRWQIPFIVQLQLLATTKFSAKPRKARSVRNVCRPIILKHKNFSLPVHS